MDKVLQRARTAIATRQRKLNRIAEANSKKRFAPERENEREERVVANTYRRLCGQAKRFQREDWRKGLLAPRRDVGVAKFTFGTVPEVLAMNSPGATNAPPNVIHKGERVVVLTGRDRGRIGVVSSVDTEKKICVVQGLNKAYRAVSKSLQEIHTGGASSVLTERPYRLCDVRLIQRVGDRDVIVDYRDKKYILGVGHLTLIPGSTVQINEPAKEAPQMIKYDADTEIADIEESSEFPELTSCPMPASVIDELRNKFSRYRTRHDAEYVDKVEQRARFEAEQADLRTRSALTPGDELKLMWKLYRRDPVLTDDMLERIGRVMVTPGAYKSEIVRQLEEENLASSASSSLSSPSGSPS